MGGRRVDLAPERAQLLDQLADRALAAQQRLIVALPLADPVTAGEPSARREHLPRARDVGGDHPVAAPERLRGVEVGDHADPAQQVVQQGRSRPADQPRGPAHLARVLRHHRRRGQGLERQERGRSGAFPVQVVERPARVLEALHHHPLQPVAQDRLHRGLEPVGHLQEVRHGAHDAAQTAGGGPREHRPYAGTVALALPLEVLEGFQGRLPRRQLHAELGQ